MADNLVVGVVGAGPAGISTVGLLLERGYKKIVWIDPYFQGGELRHFWGVPANTRSVHLSFFANSLDIFSKHCEDESSTCDVFQHYEPTETANLDELRLCLLRMTKIIRHYKEVEMVMDEAKQIIELHDNKIKVKLAKQG